MKNSHAPVIRSYASRDKASLLAILRLLVPTYFAESEIQDLDEYLENKTEQYFVAVLDDEIIGAGGINFEDNQQLAKISWDFIHPLHHNKGIGGHLLRHRLAILAKMPSVQRIIVRTSQVTYLFYAKYGFHLLEIAENYWADGFDLYLMEYRKNGLEENRATS